MFTCNNSDNGKNASGYLMVQYFRNYIVRPVGSLSATSTVDSLSSSFICNANEANTLIPPPYSRAGSPLPMSVQDYGGQVPRSASQQMEQMQRQRTVPVLVTNGNADGSGGEQVTLYRPYHDYANASAGRDEQHFVQFQRQSVAGGLGQQRSFDGHTNDGVCRVQIVRAHSADPSTNAAHATTAMPPPPPPPPLIRATTHKFTDSHVSCTSDISNVIEQTISNHATIAPDTPTSNSTNAKPKRFSYTSAAIHGLFNSYESIDNGMSDARYAMNLPIAAQMRTPSPHSIGPGSAEMLGMRPTIDGGGGGGGFAGAGAGKSGTGDGARGERQPTLGKSSSLPFSEESPVNADMLKKYGMRDSADSMSGSAVSSLANFDYPASPPQATTPTGEIRELLEQIRQLQENADSGNSEELSSFVLRLCSLPPEQFASSDFGLVC